MPHNPVICEHFEPKNRHNISYSEKLISYLAQVQHEAAQRGEDPTRVVLAEIKRLITDSKALAWATGLEPKEAFKLRTRILNEEEVDERKEIAEILKCGDLETLKFYEKQIIEDVYNKAEKMYSFEIDRIKRKMGDEVDPRSILLRLPNKLLAHAIASVMYDYGLRFVKVAYPREDELRVYDRHVLRTNADGYIESIVGIIAQGIVHERLIKEVKAVIRASYARRIKHEEVDSNPRYIPVENGLLDLHNLELKEPSSEPEPPYYSFRIPRFVDTALLYGIKEGMEWDEWRNIMPSTYTLINAMFDEENRERLFEALGSILVLKPVKALYIIKGPMRTYKSPFFIDVLGEALGPVATVRDIKELKDGKWILGFEGKLYAVTSEVDARVKLDPSLVNRVTGDAFLYGEEKYVRGRTFRNLVKLFILVNKIPMFRNLPIETVARLKLIYTKDEVEINDGVLERAKTELDAIFLFIIWCFAKYWREKIVHGKPLSEFRTDVDLETKRKLILEGQTDVPDWLEARTIRSPHAIVEGLKLWEDYKKWGGELNNIKTFYHVLEALGFEKFKRQGVTWFRGLTINPIKEEDSLISMQ